ncbi:MAG: tyrosine-protein phosphatase [Clostridiales bacterium]|nr:tyrosine-protein phosphatase [Clostridiales bacterium]
MINFRDMGGIVTADGRKIKTGLLFRADTIRPRNKKQLQYLLSLNLDYIIDLRNPYEIEKHPNFIPEGAKYINAPVLIDKVDSNVVPKSIRLYFKTAVKEEVEKDIIEFAETYKDMPYATKAYTHLFQAMNEHKKIAFHCAAGKDRTGIAAMIVQLALGCTKESVIEEYLKSNYYRRRFNRIRYFLLSLLIKKRFLRDYFVACAYAHKSYIESALKAISDKYAAIEEFLLNEYGITNKDIDSWKEFYLEKDN